MKKYVKLTLCGLAVARLEAGCAKTQKEPETTAGAAADTTAAVVD